VLFHPSKEGLLCQLIAGRYSILLLKQKLVMVRAKPRGKQRRMLKERLRG